MQDYLAERRELIASATPGIDSARALAKMTDEAVRGLSRAASVHPKGRWALVALGGWGAGALLPKSDLDILVLADARGEEHKPFVEAILYPLWDAGLKVGHQARTPKEQARAMRDDLATMTAALTGRPIAGDAQWAGGVLSDCARAVGKRRRHSLAMLLDRERPGSEFLLEPQLKEGRGGRRDFDELVWTARVLAGGAGNDLEPLVAEDLMTTEEAEELRCAAATEAEARWVLQREGFGDLMSLEAAEELGDDLAHRVQRSLAVTARALDRVRSRLGGSALPDAAPLSPEEVFALLDAGERALPALEEAGVAGRLEPFVSGYSELMTARRPGLGHQLTVGAHCLTAATTLARLGTEGGPLERSRNAVQRPRALQVAALAHDAGKAARGAGHAERGAPVALEAARRLGLSEDDAVDAGDLVRLHLALVETALSADIDDEDTILAAAERIERRELVAPLHLLTAADSLSTGPATWSGWVAALVASAASRIDAALSDAVDGAGIAARGRAVRDATLAALGPGDDAARRFAESAPLRYLATREPSEVAAHGRLLAAVADAPAGETVEVLVGTGPMPASYAVTVATIDRPELFARIAGALALAGLDILGAEAFRAPGDLALDRFIVASATRRSVDTGTWESFERYLRAALRDRLELETRLSERRRHYRAAGGGLDVETDASPGYHTVVRVTGADRPGLLYDIARAVSQSGLDIRWAKAMTVEGTVVDTFHVTGEDGSAVTDPGALGHLAMRLRDIG